MSDWPTILIVSAAPIVSAFGAIWIKERIDRRTRFEERQRTAYQKLAAVSEVIAMRSTVYNTQSGPRHATAEVMNGVTKFLTVMLLSTLPPFRNKDRELLRMLVDSLPTPVELTPIMETSELLHVMDELISARVEVHLVGSSAAIGAADELLDRSKEFLSAVSTKQMRLTTGWKKSLSAESERERMLEAHRKFVTTIRLESKTPTRVTIPKASGHQR